MKKLVYCLVIATLIVSLGLTACAKPAPEEAAWPEDIVIAAPGGETGPSYPLLGGLGMMLEKHLGVSVSVVATSGHEANPLMQRGEVHIMNPSTQGITDILRGTGPAEQYGPTPARAFLQAQIFEIEFVVLDKSGIKSFPDLEGKTICIGPRASPVGDMVMKAVADAYGFDLDKVKIEKWDRPTEAYDGLKVGRFDAIQVGSSYPTAADIELFRTYPGRILHVDDAHLAQCKQQLPWLVAQVVPGGTYEGIDEDVQSLAIAMVMVTHRDMPESFVYEMTKMVWENFDEFSAFHPACTKFKAEDVWKVIDLFPYHDGAIKYYREIGVWTKEADDIQAKLLASFPPEVQ